MRRGALCLSLRRVPERSPLIPPPSEELQKNGRQTTSKQILLYRKERSAGRKQAIIAGSVRCRRRIWRGSCGCRLRRRRRRTHPERRRSGPSPSRRTRPCPAARLPPNPCKTQPNPTQRNQAPHLTDRAAGGGERGEASPCEDGYGAGRRRHMGWGEGGGGARLGV